MSNKIFDFSAEYGIILVDKNVFEYGGLKMAVCNIISHRGANKIAPQNTLPAFRKSIDFHADGFETDVHLTFDGVPVICHNYTIDETSDGKGLITTKTLDYLKTLDFGSYFHRAYKGTRIPTLEEFLSLCEKANLKVLNIEIKPPKNGDYTVVPKTIEMVKAHGLFGRLLVSSFDPIVLTTCKDIDADCKTGFLYSPNSPHFLRILGKEVDFAKCIGADALHPYLWLVDKRLVDEAHKNGMAVNPWTVNKESDIKRLVKLGVDGVITDVPNFAREVIEKI